jgi:hypothetical protein
MGKRMRLKEDEVEIINDYRRIKDEANAEGIPVSAITSGWIKNKHASLHFKNPLFDGGGISFEQVKEAFRQEMLEHSPEYEAIIRPKLKEPHLFVLSVSDLHIGKKSVKSETGTEYGVEVAIKRAKDAVNKLMNRALGYEIDQILLPVSNDLLHVDNSTNSTTKGTPQDVDGTWHENFTAARKLYVEIIEQLMQVADVHVVHVPSNHDYVMGYCLSDALYCWFNKSKNVTFDTDVNHRKYFMYKENLIGVSHGDGAKMEHMPLLMANEAPKFWAETKYRYIYLGHLHHKNVYKFKSGKDYHGVTVEYLRSPSEADRWHHDKGFEHAKKAIEAFLHHPNEGQVARLTYNFA